MDTIISQKEQLTKEYTQLKDEYYVLFEKREHKINFEFQTLTALYIEHIGKLQYEIFELKTQVKAIKLKLGMIIAAKNRDEYVDEDKIDRIIENKLRDYYIVIANQANEVEKAINLLKSPSLSDELVKELKSIHSFFVKRLHPDINPNYTAKDEELLLRIQTAYKKLDIEYLRNALLAYQDGGYYEEDNIVSLENRIDYIKSRIGVLKDEIDDIDKSFPFVYKDKLKNPEWIATEQDIANKSIIKLNEELVKVKLVINKLLNKGGELLS